MKVDSIDSKTVNVKNVIDEELEQLLAEIEQTLPGRETGSPGSGSGKVDAKMVPRHDQQPEVLCETSEIEHVRT